MTQVDAPAGPELPPDLGMAVELFKLHFRSGLEVLVRQNDTAFLSFICALVAIDVLSGWRYLGQVKDPERFEGFIREYFPPEDHAHAPALYVLRCRMLHNSSPEGFVLVHGSREHHLTRLDDGPVKLVDACFFEAVQVAAERFFDELRRDSYRQSVMKQRLEVGPRGGAVHVIGIARGPGAG